MINNSERFERLPRIVDNLREISFADKKFTGDLEYNPSYCINP